MLNRMILRTSTLLVPLALGMALGCQGGTAPTTPPAPSPAATNLPEGWQESVAAVDPVQAAELARLADEALNAQGHGRVSLGEYRMTINWTTGAYTVEPASRTGQDVIDVTSLLTDPACPGGNCVNFLLRGRDAGTGLTSFTVFIYNPSNFLVYDTRFIWTDLQDTDLDDAGEPLSENDVIIMNPGGFTNEFDNGSPGGVLPLMTATPDYSAFSLITDDTDPDWPLINPFTNLYVDPIDRSLPGKQTAAADVEAIVREDTTTVQFIVTASFDNTPPPSEQRQDPYEFSMVENKGLLDDNINGTTQIRATLKDHQNDVGFSPPDLIHTGVEFTSPDIYENNPDDIIIMQYDVAGDFYYADLENWQALPKGDYTFYLRAHSDLQIPADQPENYDLYWKGIIKVIRDPSNGGGGGGGFTQNTFAWVSQNTGDNDIIIKRPMTGDLNLNGNDGPIDDLDPALSATYVYPGGATKRWVAWASNTGTNGKYQIWIWDLNHTTDPTLHSFAPVPVTGALDNCLAPDWKPDNTAIACQCLDSRGRWEIRSYPVSIDPADTIAPIIGVSSRLTRVNSGDNQNPSWSRSGNYIAFDSTRVRTDNPEIYVMNSLGETTSLDRMTFRNGLDTDPSWAFGVGFEQILYQQQQGDWDIFGLDLGAGFTAGSAPLSKFPCITGDNDDISPDISPDGRSVIYVSNGSGTGDFEVYTANAAIGGGGSVKRTSNEADEFRPTWGTDTEGP